MTMKPGLVNRQFNSPMGLYSPRNIQEALSSQSQVLRNGAVGIDFHQLAKPANLNNSAVLRMLEEEEARGRGQGLQDKLEKDIKVLGKKPSRVPPDWPPQSSLPKPVRWILAPSHEAPSVKPGDSNFALVGSKETERPSVAIRYPDRARSQGGLKKVAWPPPREEAEYLVEEPALVYAQAPGNLQSTPAQPPVQTYRPVPAPTFSPPPSTIVLRASPPISQPSQPVYISQPITATVQGGTRSRGDQKWPPESVKQQSAVENEARMAIAKGPAFRPRKVKKDYASFFAQHALNSTYPGYRPPPGTQHYIEEGTSNL